MGRYLNSSTSYVLYKNETMKPYFVDKTKLLSELEIHIFVLQDQDVLEKQ